MGGAVVVGSGAKWSDRVSAASESGLDRYGRRMRIGMFGVTDFAAVEFPGNPDEAAATRDAVKKAMG
jgi:5,10-methylenetetrahydromethanopterin reductase